MLKFEILETFNGIKHYLSVEPSYDDPTVGQGKGDAVLFEVGDKDGNIYGTIETSTVEARRFANRILKLCDSINEVD